MIFLSKAIPSSGATILVAAAAAMLVGAGTAAGAALSLAEAISLAERQGFDARLAEQSVRAAESDLAVARRLPNPVFSGALTRSSSVPLPNGETGTAFGYSVGVADQGAIEGTLSAKRDRRVRQAEAALGAASATREDALRVLRFQVAQGFYAILSARASETVAREVAGSFARAVELVRTRYRYGAVSEVDVVRVEAARLEADQAVTSAAAQIAQAKAVLAPLLGLEDAGGFEIAGTLEAEPPAWIASGDVDALTRAALAERPDVAAARALVDRSEAALSLARRERFPDVSLSGAYAREGPASAPITPPSVSIGATFELPVFHLRRAEIAHAESDLESAHIALSRAVARARSDVFAAWVAFRAASDLVSRMRGGLLERARRSRELVEYQYRAGAVSLIDLLDVERTALAVELEYRQDLGQLQTSIAQVGAAIGRVPS